MRRFRAAALGLAIGLVTATAASAQPARVQGFVDINMAMLEGTQHLSLAVPTVVYGSSGSINVDDSITGTGMLDVSAGLRNHRLVFGGGYSRSQTRQSHEFTAATTPVALGGFTRSLNNVTPGLNHQERIVYVFAGMVKQITERFDVTVSGGPAFFSLTQDLPTEIAQTPDIYGRYISMSTRSVDDSAIGVLAAMDVNYMLYRRVGLGLLLRYTRASVDLPDSTKSMTLGGLNIGAGARVRF